MQQPNGASYEFLKTSATAAFVNAAFRYYPIVLSAPNAAVKARLISTEVASIRPPGLAVG